MSNNMGIPVTRPVAMWNKPLKANFKDLFKAMGKATISGISGNWFGLAGDAVDAAVAVGLQNDASEIAWLLIYRSLTQAMESLVKENLALMVRQPKDLNTFYDQLDLSLESMDLTIDHHFFQAPKNLTIINAIQTPFTQWLEGFVENKAQAQAISSRLPAYFAFALYEEWKTRSKDYQSLKDKLDNPFTKASEQEQGWQLYLLWLQKRVEEPMFLEAFSLKKVYVPLRAYYEREVKSQPDQKSELGDREGKKSERVVVDLNTELKTWLQEAKNDDAIRLISGGPGSGKSSFTKIFAALQAEEGKVAVLFIPLHLFKLSDDFVKAVWDFVKLDGFLSDNPLEQKNDQPSLIIFDGLDELSMQGKIAEETAKQFVEEVRFYVERVNSHTTRLLVLISGREVVIQANRSKFRKPKQLLYLLPYFVTEEEIQNNQYVGKQNLLKDDQRQRWWQNYGKVKGKEYSALPPELDKDNLVEITSQPLLNYLVALSIERKHLRFTEDTNLNQIYGDLLEAVYERSYEQKRHRQIEEINREDFVNILEEIALASWHGNGRTTTVKEIEAHCENSGLKKILDKFQESFKEDSKASVTRLLTAFYFRESEGIRESEKTFEFTHKSFGEYLTARRIVLEIRLIHEGMEERKNSYRKGYDSESALFKWATLCGSSVIDKYLFKFIVDEIRLEDLKESSIVSNWQKTLCYLIECVMNDGMPMERLNTIPKFHEKMRQARNAEEALLAVLNACARVTQAISEIKWPSTYAFGAWIARLQGQRTREENVLSLNCLSFLDLQESILYSRDLYRANLKGAILSGAILSGAILVRAILSGAILEDANLEGANLEGAILEGAILVRAILISANLEGANLISAILSGANLEGANLVRANLISAILVRAILISANLEGANLVRANLVRAILSGAILSGANLDRANLDRAILREAHYTDNSTSQQTCESFSDKYPCPTIFPPNFDPKAAGMVLQ